MRAPEVVLGEIVWRWAFGLTMCVLLIVSFHTYLFSIEISRAEYTTLKAFEPFTWIAISLRVLHAIVGGIRTMGPALVPALSLLWIALATVGRVMTVQALCVEKAKPDWRASLLLQALRVLITFSAILAYFGAGILMARTIDPTIHFDATVFLSLVAMLIVGSIWVALNWFLSVAAIFSAKGAGISDSLQYSADLYFAGTSSVGILFSLMRTAALIATSFFSFFLFTAMLSGHWRGPFVGIVFLTMIYFAIADFLYMWRLATYIGLTEPPQQTTPLPSPLPLAPEQILLENPQPATETASSEDVQPPVEELKADS